MRGVFRYFGVVMLAMLGMVGCQQLFVPVAFEEKEAFQPTQEFRVGYFVVKTGDRVDETHPLFKELEGLSERVCRELEIPLPKQLVSVHLFTSEAKYREYCKSQFQNLPSRRALFVGRQEGLGAASLQVYAFWGEHVAQDLRHELTHATLHASVGNVPLWLDEGIAEYFELPVRFKGMHHKHLSALRDAEQFPVDMKRLEGLNEVAQMSAVDYREAWAWVHWMMHKEETKKLLSRYLKSVGEKTGPGPLYPELLKVTPQPEEALEEYLKQLREKTKSWGETKP